MNRLDLLQFAVQKVRNPIDLLDTMEVAVGKGKGAQQSIQVLLNRGVWITGSTIELAGQLDYTHQAGTLEFLLKSGADPNARWMIDKDHCGLTPLMWAGASGIDTKSLETLIKYGANVNAIDAKGNSVLDYWKSNPPALAFLKSIGAKSGEEITSLHRK